MCKRGSKRRRARSRRAEAAGAARRRCGHAKSGNKNYLSPREQKMGVLRAIAGVWLALALWCATHDEGWR